MTKITKICWDCLRWGDGRVDKKILGWIVMKINGVYVRYVRCRRTEERKREEIIRCNLSLCLSFSPFLLPFVLFLASPLPLSNINEQFFFRTVAVVSHRHNCVFFFSSFHRLVINKNSAIIRYVPDSQSFFLFISTSEREREKRFATVTSNNTQK